MQELESLKHMQDGLIVRGDNVKALSSLSPCYDGSVKCVYTDPPYRNGDDFTCYEDSTDHNSWIKACRRCFRMFGRLSAAMEAFGFQSTMKRWHI